MRQDCRLFVSHGYVIIFDCGFTILTMLLGTEINDVISGGAKPVFDQAGSVQHLTWGGDNWVS